MEHKCKKTDVKSIEKCDAEQINDILDKMDFFQGQRASRELWNGKPFDVQEQDIANFSRDVALIKAYINELTDENERLRAEIDNGAEVCHNCHTEYANKIEQARADTVREMQERLKERNKVYCINEADLKEMNCVIDQIAKEVLKQK